MQPVKQKHRLALATKATHRKTKQKASRSDSISLTPFFSLTGSRADQTGLKRRQMQEIAQRSYGRLEAILSTHPPNLPYQPVLTDGATGEQRKSDPDGTVELVLYAQLKRPL